MPFIDKWIIDSIVGVLQALEKLEQTIAEKNGTTQSEVAKCPALLDQKVSLFSFSYKKRLVEEERELNYAHTRMLAAVNTMHMLLLNPQSLPFISSPTKSLG